MTNLKISVILCLLPTLLLAQVDFKKPYHVGNIPAELLKNANVVVREYSLDFKVKNKGEAIEEEHKVITILNDKAEGYDEPVFDYDKISELDDIEAVIYDETGKQIKKMKKKDIEDFKPYELYINDARCKKIKFPRLSYPYTIEYTVTKKHNGLLFYPRFAPQSNSSEAIMSATFNLTMPADLKARVKEINVPSGAKDNETHWTFQNISAFKAEAHMPENQHFMPIVLTAPTDFKIEEYEGNMETWENFGKFLNKLNEGRNILPDALKTKLKEVVKDCKDDYCKIEKIYEMMQNSTRYFYVGLGIGGWQPAAASDVNNFKYGDCKGLSNYMVSMLNVVGVPARYVLIRAGDDNLTQYPDFPNPFFNHAIACVPMQKDTLWLECTSQTESCGFLSDFTDSRNALIVTPDGGKLVKTPIYNEKINTVTKKTFVKINPQGNATVDSEDVFTGIKEGTPAYFAEMNNEHKKKYLYKTLNINNFEIKSFNFERKKGRLPSVTQKINLEVPNLASVSGKRLFVPTNLLSKWTNIPLLDTIRRFEVQADSRGFSESDNLTIEFPEGYKTESQLTPISITSPFGKYEVTMKLEANKLLITRQLVINNSIHPKEKFQALVDFFKAISKADKGKIVLIPN